MSLKRTFAGVFLIYALVLSRPSHLAPDRQASTPHPKTSSTRSRTRA